MEHPPCLFGEVLFDVFPDGREVLGGAPFNVAWHLQGFGLKPLLISRVGADAAGDQIRQSMAAWGMRLDGLQIDPIRPTGRVIVSFIKGEPSFDIVPGSAWDFIAARGLPAVEPGILYHGSLASRAPVAAATLKRLVKQFRNPGEGWMKANAAAKRFVDVNLRDPWWRAEEVGRLLAGADWAKLNQEELARLSDGKGGRALEDQAEAFRARQGLDGLLVTLGAAGALGLNASGEAVRVRPEAVPLVDAVGAGDAFAAVAILGLYRNWPLATTLERAQGFASRIVQTRGATIQDPALYRSLREQWGL